MDDARRKPAKRTSSFRRPGPAQKTVPDAAASSPRSHPAARPRTHAKSTRARSPAAWRHSAASPASAIDSGIRHARPNLRTCRHTTDEGPRQRASGRRTGGDATGLTQAAPSAAGSPAGHNGGRPPPPFSSVGGVVTLEVPVLLLPEHAPSDNAMPVAGCCMENDRCADFPGWRACCLAVTWPKNGKHRVCKLDLQAV